MPFLWSCWISSMSCNALLSMLLMRPITFRTFLALMNDWSDDVVEIFFLFFSWGSFGAIFQTMASFSIDLSMAHVRSLKYSSKSLRCSKPSVGSASIPSFASYLTLLRCLVSVFCWNSIIFCSMLAISMSSLSWRILRIFVVPCVLGSFVAPLC